jgi:hypothetical protein
VLGFRPKLNDQVLSLLSVLSQKCSDPISPLPQDLPAASPHLHRLRIPQSQLRDVSAIHSRASGAQMFPGSSWLNFSGELWQRCHPAAGSFVTCRSRLRKSSSPMILGGIPIPVCHCSVTGEPIGRAVSEPACTDAVKPEATECSDPRAYFQNSITETVNNGYATTTRSRPSSLARYSAASEALNNASPVVPCWGYQESPIDMVTRSRGLPLYWI